MLFRLLVVVVLFYLVRNLFLRLFSGEEGTRTFSRREETGGLDLSQYDVEDAEYQELEDDDTPP